MVDGRVTAPKRLAVLEEVEPGWRDKFARALGAPRVALVFEGTGVAYVRAKLIPLHGELAAKTDVWSDHTEFTEEYKGFITTVEGPQMPDEQLKVIQAKLVEEASKAEPKKS